MTKRYDILRARFSAGEMIVLDGATGTELQRRGVAMDPTAWCGGAAVSNRGVLEEVHGDYIAAGAEIITANTFATSRLVLQAAGLGDRFDEINRVTLAAAMTAREKAPAVLVAGSLSHMVPRRDRHGDASSGAFADAAAELAQVLASSGCDLILLEMMFAPERMAAAFEAALATGLPVWAGFSARRGAAGEVLSFARARDIPFREIAGILADYPVDAAGVMHSESAVTADALGIVRHAHAGPLTAYPDSGHMKLPEWQFDEVIAVDEFREYAQGWADQGVQAIGGCCGLGLDHIRAVAGVAKDFNGRRRTGPGA